MENRCPRVSMGLPVFNGETYLHKALDSLLAQEYEDFELVISDNASADGTPEICQEYAAKDHRIRYYRNERNIGASGNFNRVFELARGEFFKWMPHDDECHPSLLRRCIETFEDASAHTVLVCARSQIIDETKRVVHVSRLKVNSSPRPFSRLASLISNRDYPHALFGLIRSKALRQTRLMGVVHADHILLAELALLGSFVEIPADLQQWRIHSRTALKINRTSRQLLSWHDPKKVNSRIILPHWLAWDLEYFRAIRRITTRRTLRNAGLSLNPQDTRTRHGIPSYAIRRDSKSAPKQNESEKPSRSLKSRVKSPLSNHPVLYRLIGAISEIVIEAPRSFLQEVSFLVESFQIIKSFDCLIISGGGQLCEI